MNCELFVFAVDGDWESFGVHVGAGFAGLPPVQTVTEWTVARIVVDFDKVKWTATIVPYTRTV